MSPFIFEAEITPGMGTADFCRLAKEVEVAGFDRLGVSDVVLWPDAYQLQVLAAQATEKIMIGSMVTNPYTRHPSVHAASLATLNDVSNGRAFCGIGIGAGLEEIGISPEKPVLKLRETIEAIRNLLTGEKVTSQGVTVRLDGARLARPSSSYIPIAIGTRSPQVMRLAGEIADIALVGARNFTESTVERYKGWLAEGAERVGRNPEEIEVAPRVTLCISNDSKAAISSLKRYAAHYLDIAGEHGPPIDDLRKEKIIAALERSSGWYFDHDRFDDPELESLVDYDLVRSFAIVGTPKEAAEQLKEILNLGFTQVSCNLASVRRSDNTMAEGLEETIKGASEALRIVRRK